MAHHLYGMPERLCAGLKYCMLGTHRHTAGVPNRVSIVEIRERGAATKIRINSPSRMQKRQRSTDRVMTAGVMIRILGTRKANAEHPAATASNPMMNAVRTGSLKEEVVGGFIRSDWAIREATGGIVRFRRWIQ